MTDDAANYMAKKRIDTVTHWSSLLSQAREQVYPSLGIKGCRIHEKSGREKNTSPFFPFSRVQRS